MATRRYNIIPIVEDGRRPKSYYSIFGTVQTVYCDIAQPDQTDIAIENCKVYLEKGGVLLLVVKSRSIDVVKDPRVVIKEEAKKLESNGFSIQQIIDLEPFDKDHGMIYAVYRSRVRHRRKIDYNRSNFLSSAPLIIRLISETRSLVQAVFAVVP